MIKKNKILIGCLSLLLVLSVGYALFSETITINGTATAKGSFDIGVECSLVTEDNPVAGIIYTNGGTGRCNVNGNTVTTTSTLTSPGQLVIYEVTLTNNGTIPAVLKTVDSSNDSVEGGDAAGDQALYDSTKSVVATYGFGTPFMGDSVVEEAGIILQPGDSVPLNIFYEWINISKQPELPETGVTMDYDITLGFEQVTAN